MLTEERLKKLDLLFSSASYDQVERWYLRGHHEISHEEYEFYYYLWVNGPRLEPPMTLWIDPMFRKEASFAEKYDDFKERAEFIRAIFAEEERSCQQQHSRFTVSQERQI